MAMSGKFWLLTLPNEGRSGEGTFERLRKATDEYSKGYLVQVPSLTVGTLDTLMALSDDMEKVDQAVENAVRKIEKQYADVAGADLKANPLLIDAVPVERYLPSFVWEHSKYPHRRPLPELVQSIQQAVGSTEDELKQMTMTYADKSQKLTALQRKKGGDRGANNLATAPFEEILSPDFVTKIEFVETEYLTTLLVVVPKASEATWLETYATIGAAIVPAAGSDAPTNCSPAVPGSSKKVFAEGDQSLWTLTLLKGQQKAGHYVDDQHFAPGDFTDFVAAYTTEAKSLAFHVRKFSYDKDRVATMERENADLNAEVGRLHATIVRWCRTHFAETYVAWVHLKLIRAFVESVLRYGLPLDFITCLVMPFKNRDLALQAALDKLMAHMKSINDFDKAQPDDDDDDPANAEYHPFVVLKSTALWSAN